MRPEPAIVAAFHWLSVLISIYPAPATWLSKWGVLRAFGATVTPPDALMFTLTLSRTFKSTPPRCTCAPTHSLWHPSGWRLQWCPQRARRLPSPRLQFRSTLPPPHPNNPVERGQSRFGIVTGWRLRRVRLGPAAPPSLGIAGTVFTAPLRLSTPGYTAATPGEANTTDVMD
ncbi:hypothetical protein H257_06965 [Aphanomyces astaci]|uniref:Uncharacterized protein n=1 Tax=Aphanomyces astaci TaxID=112090 RepID=W4GLE6_APHAT|nr:hypothetical protein H257_06965 [Aphanomyces astaci]ETV79728.1 hypothetical protein H257_06965 [Aphanomyces astaci]|eukprot:XP_009830664.1 hypothetical protein H257_06965 [Aphanomyces astaci]